MHKRQSEIEQQFLSNNCLLLDNYEHCQKKMKYQCSCGNISEISYNNFSKGRRCKQCKISKLRADRQFSFEYVKQYFEDNNCELLESAYINNQTKMKYKCQCGNISETKFSHFKNGSRCRQCMAISMTGSNNSSWNPDRNKVRSIKRIHRLSYSYKRNFRKKHNVLNSNLHVDHIFPIKAFVEHNIFDLEIINSENNLQILDAKENSGKGGKYDKLEFKQYLSAIKEKIS